MSDGDTSPGDTERCECSEGRLLIGVEACDEKHPEKRFICTRPPDHDGPHSACTPAEHPVESWEQDDSPRTDGGTVEEPAEVNPLDVECPKCLFKPGRYCRVLVDEGAISDVRKPHKERIQKAKNQSVAADTDHTEDTNE